MDLHNGYLNHSKGKNYAEKMDSKKVIIIHMIMDKTERKEKGESQRTDPSKEEIFKWLLRY